MPNVIVTGLPRAGSALMSALIDSLPDCISLNTPPVQVMQAKASLFDPITYCKWLAGDFLWTRQALLNGEPVADLRNPDSTPVLDGMHMPFSPHGYEEGVKEPEACMVSRPGLTADFTLAMRHTTFYTSLLPTLVKFNHFTIIAVIRHPLDVLNSWRRLKDPIMGRGKPMGIARFWPEALALAENKMEAADRLVQLYDAYIERYHNARDHICILRYEDIIENPMLVSELVGAKEMSPGAKRIEQRPRIHVTAEANVFRERFRKYSVFTKLYYPDI